MQATRPCQTDYSFVLHVKQPRLGRWPCLLISHLLSLEVIQKLPDGHSIFYAGNDLYWPPADATVRARRSAIFLFSQSILVLTSTPHGWLVILNKEDRSILPGPTHVALCSSLVAVGLTLFISGLNS